VAFFFQSCCQLKLVTERTMAYSIADVWTRFGRSKCYLKSSISCHFFIPDTGRSLAAGLRRQAANHRKRRWSRASVVRVTEKAQVECVR
jgi:hypothetical protein